MQANEQIALVEAYFAAVDAEDLPSVLSTLTEGCVFSVETHGVRLQGHDEIVGMFRRLWANHRSVRHHTFVHVPAPQTSRIASRFQVENIEHDGQVTRKSNCNFFEIQNGKFAAVAVYMSGGNTLNGAQD